MTDTSDAYSTFHPFGDGVRIGAYGAAGNADIHANLYDLCQRYGVDYDDAKHLTFPDGSLMLLQIESDKMAAELYLSEEAYQVFMAWVSEVQQ